MGNYKTDTIKSYNKNVKGFSEKFKNLLELKKRPEFKRFIELLKGNKILDLGCGAGDHSKYFVEQGLDVTCVDLSEEMVKLCKGKNLKSFVMDIEDLKFEDNLFDGVWAVTSLLHIPKLNLPKVIDRLYKILDKEGILYVCVEEGEGEKIKDDKRFFAYWTKEELLNLFENKFELIEFNKSVLGKRTFLGFFFRKD